MAVTTRSSPATWNTMFSTPDAIHPSRPSGRRLDSKNPAGPGQRWAASKGPKTAAIRWLVEAPSNPLGPRLVGALAGPDRWPRPIGKTAIRGNCTTPRADVAKVVLKALWPIIGDNRGGTRNRGSPPEL